MGAEPCQAHRRPAATAPRRPDEGPQPETRVGAVVRCVRSAVAGPLVGVVVRAAGAGRAAGAHGARAPGPAARADSGADLVRAATVVAAEGDLVGRPEGVVVELVTGRRVVEAGLESMLVSGVV